ncbi:MAG TPA: hypothetical protein PKE49_03510 [Leptospiraceae bacterium]|nr:hypothetical protein [Leptospirales bacterium]HMW60853.1 hypothetical protein [Leptospiraceae bacterium]HMX55562.1 hypothetical protein [Leptospiraceae bacterium]HNJ03324.1 hypothetical protein [Leptospiraceae bacterium]HNN59128.1 hypothetical protein [Leptospiraceae bacterium]
MDELWDRIQNRRERLAELCETVDRELEENRKTRDRWYTWTDSWKRVWAPWLDQPTKPDP